MLMRRVGLEAPHPSHVDVGVVIDLYPEHAHLMSVFEQRAPIGMKDAINFSAELALFRIDSSQFTTHTFHAPPEVNHCLV